MKKIFTADLKSIKGIGSKKEELLKKLNIYNVYDLITYFPKSYEDFTEISYINDKNENRCVYKLKIISNPSLRRIRGNMNILSAQVVDEQGVEAEIVFFNQPFLSVKLKKGRIILVSGILKYGMNRIQIQSPKILNKDEIGNLNPIYALTEGITNKNLAQFINNAIALYDEDLDEFLPYDFIKKYDLMEFYSAIKAIHKPKNSKVFFDARKRLVFNEVLFLQLNLLGNKGFNFSKDAPKMSPHQKEIKSFIDDLPFTLTNAQNRVINEILKDMCAENPMARLLQGDVGSGKTVVAAILIYLSYLNGYQSALMAPTEILAKQHYESFKSFFEKTELNVGILIGEIKQTEKDKILSGLKNGKIDLLIGTHALIQESVEFKNLGLSITDEQHRFGVQQRKALIKKGISPHNLVMSATPIPRTLALVLYGDMKISSIDELPPGRKKIETIIINESYIDRMDNFLIQQIKEGRQAYIVCPLIEETDTPLKSLEEVFSHYKSEKFKNISVEYLHGKMKNEEKESIMQKFVDGKIDVLVSTTVIEVGINVPNANLMIIYNADRFGLSQLHQLRGRVGRGSFKSYAILINNNKSINSYQRMKIMQDSNDGFYIAKKDLELRGQGQLLGNRQHGVLELKLTDLTKDLEIIENAQNAANEIYQNLQFEKNGNENLKEFLFYFSEKMKQSV